MKKEWNKSIYLFIECCGGKLVKAYPTQPPSISHNMTMDMPVSHLIRGWLPDVASTGSASHLNVSARDFRVDFTPVLSLLCTQQSHFRYGSQPACKPWPGRGPGLGSSDRPVSFQHNIDVAPGWFQGQPVPRWKGRMGNSWVWLSRAALII